MSQKIGNMHWADKIADQIIQRNPGNTLTCASGVSPSGPVHVGNLRDILTLWFVAKALRERSVSVRVIHSWDDFDRFRKVPQNIPESFRAFLGKPLSKVPDPFDQYPSYAARYESEFEASLAELGITLEFIRQTERYESGVYRPSLCEAVEKRELLYDILSRFRTQEASDEARESFFPLTIYCERCGKDTTVISHKAVAGTVLPYLCKCSHEGVVDLRKANHIKLPWKVDWAMRWRHEGVVFEPGGKDHATSGGSFEVSREIAMKVFHYTPPIFQPYEFIGIKGKTGKMSGSSGVLLTPRDLLKIYTPELLLWIFAKTEPNRAFNVVTDEGIYRLYDEFDQAFKRSPPRDMSFVQIPGRSCDSTSFRYLAEFSGIVNENRVALAGLLTRMGISCDASLFEERLQKAINWLCDYAPEQRTTLLKERQEGYFGGLSEREQDDVRTLHSALQDREVLDLEEVTHRVYDIPKRGLTSEEEWPAAQRRFFQILYHLLFGKDKGPRLPTFFAVVPKEQYIALLNFGEGDVNAL